MNKKELKDKLHKYILEHPGAWTSEIIETFEEYDTYDVLKALEFLEKEGKVV